jgi:hypothetical protein
VDKFVGGGFAGQVYRVKILDIESGDGAIEGLEVGGIYAIKILIPPSNFSRLFRNVLYWIGFQGPFQLQVNPFAARPARCGKNSSGGVQKSNLAENHPWWIFMQPLWMKNWAVVVS